MKDFGQNFDRKSLRLPEYDYSQDGAYFVTLISHQRQHLFGEIKHGEMILNEIGKIIQEIWWDIPGHFPKVNSDIFVVMPNHIHGIILVDRVGATHASPLRYLQKPSLAKSAHRSRPKGPMSKSLGAIIGSFKSAASKRIHQINGYHSCRIWQQNYYEHVLRDKEELQRLADYIEFNPMNWADDAILSSL